MDYEVFFIPLMLQASYNEIVSNIVNCRMCFSGEKSKKKNVKIKTNNEKIGETGMNIWYNTYKKTLLESGRNIAMSAARIICNLLLKAQNMPET